MNGWRLTGAELKEWVADLLRSGKRVLAPVERGTLRTFLPIASLDDACLKPGKARWPAKEHLFPRTETVFSYTTRGGEVTLTPAPQDETLQVLFGVRPCDAAGFTRLDAMFNSGPGDTLYAGRRKRSTVVSLACSEAEPECFCSAVGGHPAGEEGADVLVLPAGGAWIVRPLTDAGEALTQGLASRPAVTEGELAEACGPMDQLAERIGGKKAAREWAEALEKSFDQPLWEAVGQRCLGCSICNYLCPSCSCFDVQDSGNAWCGDRCRSWDSCTFATFTRHGSGHNPRPDQPSRYRQRVLHKFSYFPQAHEGQWMCVGCGRCAAHCPVGLSIRDSVERVVGAGATEAGA